MVQTYKQKFNKKFGFPPDESHSIEDISRITGYDKKGLDVIQKKGEGAFFSNPQSVRPQITNPVAWGRARIYSAVMGGKAQEVDKSHLLKKDILRVRFGQKAKE
jgi:hypothetical protein